MTHEAPDVTARADEYARRVEDALADLPPGQRKQLLADLASHLAEITDDGRPVVDQLGPPEDYARELRAAADLIPAGAPGRAGRAPWVVRAAVITAVAVAVLVGSGVWVHSRPAGAPVAPGAPATPAAPARPVPVPPTVAVPDVLGRPLPEAAAVLKAVGFAVAEVTQPQPATPPGLVLSSSPEPGERAVRGSVVTLVVSTSEEDVTVPDVVGMSQAAAVGALQNLGLSVVLRRERPSVVRPDLVISTTPGAGSEAPRGSAITVVVSSGP